MMNVERLEGERVERDGVLDCLERSCLRLEGGVCQWQWEGWRDVGNDVTAIVNSRQSIALALS
jgi:hypothetical protein